MAEQGKNLRKIRGRPATGRGDQINVMLRPETSAALDAYSASEAQPLTRPQAIRAILTDWRCTHGFGGTDQPKPKGPASHAVKVMDAAIKENREVKRKKRAMPSKPPDDENLQRRQNSDG